MLVSSGIIHFTRNVFALDVFPNLGCDGGNLQSLRPADNILAPKLAASYQLMPRG